ncbi:MAG: hypothetical protein ACLPZM_06440 [Thermoplasmata archaeon]
METTATDSSHYMSTSFWGKRAVPLGLGVAMLATLVAAALSPNIGAVPVQAACQYSNCSSGTSSPFPWWIVGVIAVLIVALLAAYLIFGRRRPPAQGGKGPAAWEPPAGAAAGGAGAGGATTPTSPAAPSTPEGPAPSYIETPDDIGSGLPEVASAAAVGGAAAGGATGAAAGEDEPDIDSLMAELDKISGEILKKAPKTGKNSSSTTTTSDETGK